MVLMPDRGIGAPGSIPPLPPFVTPEELALDALPLLDPPSRISVTEAAERYLRVPMQGNWQPFDRNVTPYMVEPADITQSRRFRGVIFVGPSQAGKSQMLLSISAHAVLCSPGPVQLIHMTKTDADAWVEEKLDPAIANSPAIREKLGGAREDSTFSRKRFRGMRLTIGYPVANQLSSRSQRLVLLTDLDHMPQRLGPKDSPEGSPFGMALQRIKTYLSRGCVVAESTPAFPVDPEKAAAADTVSPHMLPPAAAGIVPLYNDATRGRWYWQCPDCGDLFEPRVDRLHYDRALDPGDAAAVAEMKCPHCGCLIAHRHKVELNRAAMRHHGGWLHESRRLGSDGRRELCRIDDADIRQTPYAGYALNGAAAAFASWADIVQRLETERRRFDATGDDIEFARVHYTDIGVPYARPVAKDENDLTPALLRENAVHLERGVAPAWTRFVTVSIDVQGRYFAVMVVAWGAEGERQPIDRFDLVAPPDDAPRAMDHEGRPRGIDPGRYAEDAHVLLPLAERSYQVAGEPWALKPKALVIDFNGPPGWSDNAEKFWRARRVAGDGPRWFLSIGRSGFNQSDRVWLAAPERGSKGRKARSIKLLNMATDRLKDSVLSALARFDGAGSQRIPAWMEEDQLAEFLAEARTAKGYEKKPGVRRNEGLDHSVQALAVAEHLGINRINWEDPPDWAVLGTTNPMAVRTETDTTKTPQPATAQATPSGIKWLRR